MILRAHGSNTPPAKQVSRSTPKRASPSPRFPSTMPMPPPSPLLIASASASACARISQVVGLFASALMPTEVYGTLVILVVPFLLARGSLRQATQRRLLLKSVSCFFGFKLIFRSRTQKGGLY